MLIRIHCAVSQRDTTLCPWDVHQAPFNSLLWDEKLCFLHQTAYRTYRCKFKANSSLCSSSEAREGLPHFLPLKEEARGQRGSGLKLSSHTLSVLRRCREREATCSSRESVLLAGIQAWFRTQVTEIFSGAAHDLKPFIYIIKPDWKGNRITESK